MTEPSVLTYARYFDLTKELSRDDIWRRLDVIQKCPSPEKASEKLDNEFSPLIQAFQSAAAEHLSLANDDTLHVPQDVTDFLRSCTDCKKPDMAKIYDDLLPDPRRIQKLKLPLPLLLIGGGDVWKDVGRIKGAMNFERILDNFIEDYEGRSVQSTGHTQQHLVSPSEILDIVRTQFERAVHNQKINVNAKTIEYLRVALTVDIKEKDRFDIIRKSLPELQVNKFSACAINEVDFDLDDELADHTCSSQRRHSSPEDVEATSTEVKQEAVHDLLSPADAAADPEISAFAISTQQDKEMEDLFRQYVNDVYITPDTDNVSEYERVRKENINLTPTKQELSQESSENARQHKTSRRLKLSMQKADEPAIDGIAPDLPAIDLSSLLSQFQPSSADRPNAFNLQDQQNNLPFPTPTIQDVLKESWTENEAVLMEFVGKEKKIITSDQLLWKEPGFRILDRIDQDEDLVLGDFCIDDFESNVPTTSNGSQPFKSADFQLKGEDSLEVENPKHNNIALTESSPQNEVGIVDQVFAEAEGKIFQPSSSQNPFETPSPVCKTSSMSANTMAREEPPKVPLKLSKVVGAVLDWPTTTMEPESSYFGINSLSTFLDLRGKQFKRTNEFQVSKVKEIQEDPIQSTQDGRMQPLLGSDPEPTDRSHRLPTTSSLNSHNLPELAHLEGSRAIVLNNRLLQQKPLLVQFLERRSSNLLLLIYRELDIAGIKGPDLILNANTCLIITNLQSLSQRPLPGQKSFTGLSPAHDQIADFVQKYDRTFVLIHYVISLDLAVTEKNTIAQSQMVKFCQDISKRTQSPVAKIVPIWVPTADPSCTSDMVNAWVWRLVCKQAHVNTSAVINSTKGQPDEIAPALLIREETLWELFLMKAGLNPMAAQVVISVLRQALAPNGGHGDDSHNWCLRKLVSMDPRTRHDLFDTKIGQRAVLRLNQVLRS